MMHDQPADEHADVETIEDVSSHAHQQVVEAHRAQLEAKMRNGANWFYWIAGLSLVNSAILLSEGDHHFLIGLGITQFVNALALTWAKQSPETAVVAKVIAGIFTLFTAAVVSAFGFGTNRRHSWLFITGMILYTFDGLIYILFEDWLSIAFHLFVLTRLFTGFRACRDLNAAETQVALQET
jgi:hypothetical protein